MAQAIPWLGAGHPMVGPAGAVGPGAGPPAGRRAVPDRRPARRRRRRPLPGSRRPPPPPTDHTMVYLHSPSARSGGPTATAGRHPADRPGHGLVGPWDGRPSRGSADRAAARWLRSTVHGMAQSMAWQCHPWHGPDGMVPPSKLRAVGGWVVWTMPWTGPASR